VAPVFFLVVGGSGDDLCDFGGPSTMGSLLLAAFLSAFHLSQAGVPAASMTSAKIINDRSPSIVKVFFFITHPLKAPQRPQQDAFVRSILNVINKLDCQVSVRATLHPDASRGDRPIRGRVYLPSGLS
jgi:hypothetical protein